MMMQDQIVKWTDQVQAISGVFQALAALLVAIGGVIAAKIAISTYKASLESQRQQEETRKQQASLERAKWLASLYEKFYEEDHLKEVRDALDCREASAPEIAALVKTESSAFTDYLNFFEFVAFLERGGQLNFEEVDQIFGYYLACIQRRKNVRRYVRENGYELLEQLLIRIEKRNG